MPSVNFDRALDQLKLAWVQFTTTGQLPPEMDPLVAMSWQRCAPRLNPNSPPLWASLRADVLALTLRQHQTVLSIARPLLEDVYQLIEGSGLMLIFVDSTIGVLDYLGDPPMLEAMEQFGVRRGVFLAESRVGTNALASALAESTPAKVWGAEHFLSAFHHLSSAAAPIFDLEAGRSVGAVGVFTRAEAHDPYASAMMAGAARAIENQLQANSFVAEANARATELNTTLNAISDGVIAWNADGLITHLNAQAGKLLGLKPATVVGRSLAEYLALPEPLAGAVARGDELTDAEVTFQLEGQPRETLVTLRVIRQADAPSAYIATLRRIEQVHQLVNRLVGAQARLSLDDLVGQSRAIRWVRRQAQAMAGARACILIQGEPGTGKNILARAIHNSSHRAHGPFIAVNCRAIPRELVLGEFLGFEAGAFNRGVAGGVPSKFELAHGGTLMLEEVETLPPGMQAALLRVIEAGDVIRLGGTRVIPVDVRLIATTAASLEALVADGTFRSDLLFRLNAFTIALPALRDRPDDIPLLIERLLERLSAQFDHVVALAAEAHSVMLAYPWPGNVRELEAALERAALLADGQAIGLTHLPQAIRERRAIVPGKPVTEPVHSLVDVEKQAIQRAIRAARGNMTQTATILGIGRTTLWRKIKELDISPD